MAGQITGRFLADFSQFSDAVNKATTQLTGMETGASKVQTSLNRMVDQFSGRKIIQEAELMGKTFELLAEKGIGLTTSELQRMGRVGEEAIAKLKAGGEQVPPEIQKIVDAAKKVEPAMDSAKSSTAGLLDTVRKAASVFGVAFSLGALTNFIGKVFDTASAIKDLSQSLGLSTDELQRFKFAAEQGGGKLDDVGNSIRFMQQKLVDGSKETAAALDTLGLKLNAVRELSPGEALLTVTDALKGMENPAQRTTTQIDLLGKASSGLGPTIASGFREATEAANIMSKQTIEDLEKAQQAWENLGNAVVIISGNIIAGTMRTVKEVTGSWEKFLIFAGNATKMGIGPAAALASATAEAASAANDLAQNSDKVSGTLGKTKLETDAAAEAAKKLKQEWETYITGALKRGDDLLKYIDNLEKGLKTVDDTMGKFVTGHLKDLGERGQKILGLTSDAAVRLGLDMSGLHPVIEGVGKDFLTFSETGIRAVDTLKDAIAKLPETFEHAIGRMQSSVNGWLDISLGDVERAFGPRAASAFGQFQQLSDDTFQAVSGLARVMAGDFSGFVDLIVGGINSIKTQWKILIGLFNPREGRHAVVDFAESFGGFDALHERLLTLGSAGEDLWIKLTQGVPAGNPKAAADAIAEVEEALANQEKAADDVTKATEDQAQATIETASQAAKALEELGPKIDTNKDQWKGWGDLVTSQIQRIADGIRNMPLPLPNAAAIAGGGSLNGGGTFTGSTGDHLVIESNLYIDGYVAAESVSRQVVG